MNDRHNLKILTKLYEQIQPDLFKHEEFSIFPSNVLAPIDFYLRIEVGTTDFLKLNLYNARIEKMGYRLGEIKTITPKFTLKENIITLKSNKFLIEIIKQEDP